MVGLRCLMPMRICASAFLDRPLWLRAPRTRQGACVPGSGSRRPLLGDPVRFVGHASRTLQPLDASRAQVNSQGVVQRLLQAVVRRMQQSFLKALRHPVANPCVGVCMLVAESASRWIGPGSKVPSGSFAAVGMSLRAHCS